MSQFLAPENRTPPGYLWSAMMVIAILVMMIPLETIILKAMDAPRFTMKTNLGMLAWLVINGNLIYIIFVGKTDLTGRARQVADVNLLVN